jgi:hypothetical protein
VPVLAADDVTEEDGFAAFVRMGGIAIKVSEWPRAEVHRLATVSTSVAGRGDLRRRLRADEGTDQRRGERP